MLNHLLIVVDFKDSRPCMCVCVCPYLAIDIRICASVHVFVCACSYSYLCVYCYIYICSYIVVYLSDLAKSLLC